MKRENHQHHRGGILKLVIATGILGLACATSYAQSVLGSSGAGWQTWNQQGLNNNGAPFWDAPTTSDPTYNGQQANGHKNIGFCLAGLGDCAAPNGLAGKPPGPIPFWGQPYKAATDTGGGIDFHVYFHAKGEERPLKATLLANISTIPVETNPIGWFETDAKGSVIGKLHQLFQGGHCQHCPPSGPPPSPIGSTVTFTPTEYFGFYFLDVSEGSCLSTTLLDVSAANPNNSNCGALSDYPAWLHNMVVFGKSGKRPRYYIAGQDPPGCGDSDCNLTVIKITQGSDEERDDE